MVTVIVSLVLAVVVFCVMFYKEEDVFASFKFSGFILVIGLANLIPANEPYKADEVRSGYVVECKHDIYGCEHMVTYAHVTLLQSALNDDDTQIHYCPECYTRKEAIEVYNKAR